MDRTGPASCSHRTTRVGRGGRVRVVVVVVEGVRRAGAVVGARSDPLATRVEADVVDGRAMGVGEPPELVAAAVEDDHDAALGAQDDDIAPRARARRDVVGEDGGDRAPKPLVLEHRLVVVILRHALASGRAGVRARLGPRVLVRAGLSPTRGPSPGSCGSGGSSIPTPGPPPLTRAPRSARIQILGRSN